MCDEHESTISFLMVVTDVNEYLQETVLHTVYDGEPPAEMKWLYGLSPIDTGQIDDKVGECYRVTLEKLP